jgi:hypothetical protein
MTALCKLHELSRRGKPFNWNKVEGTAEDAVPHPDIEDTKTVKTLPPSSPASPRPEADQCPFCFFAEGLSEKDRLRPYARIDSLRRHVLRIHLKQASRHNYGLRDLPYAYSHTPIEDRPVTCPVPRCGGLVLENQMHYMNHSSKIHKGPF